MLPILKILVPVDFSRGAEGALAWAISLAANANAGLILFHSIEWSYEIRARVEKGIFKDKDYRAQTIEQLTAKLGDWSKKCLRQGLAVETELRIGRPDIEIMTAAKDLAIDLIVMGTHGVENSPHVLIGSVAEKVARKASCPVLTIKAPHFRYKAI